MKHYGYESTGNEHPHKKLLIVQQILLVSPWEMYGEQEEEYAYPYPCTELRETLLFESNKLIHQM